VIQGRQPVRFGRLPEDEGQDRLRLDAIRPVDDSPLLHARGVQVAKPALVAQLVVVH
jgi:hypothetical protein